MQNVNVSLEGTKLTVEMDVSEKGTLSKAGRSFVVSQTKNPVAFDKLDDIGLPGYMLKVMLIRAKDAEPYSLKPEKPRKLFRKIK